MRSVFCASILITFGLAASAGAANAAEPVLAYSSAGACLASPEGFTRKLEPVNSGIAWRTTFRAVSSADANGNVTEVGQSVDSASFGVGPRMHTPAVSAYTDEFASVTKPNADGSLTLHVGTVSGTFTAGPDAGLTFTISGIDLKGWAGKSGVRLFGNGGSPTIQTFALSNGTRFQRICAVLTISASPLR